jgi:hypothetical protein
VRANQLNIPGRSAGDGAKERERTLRSALETEKEQNKSRKPLLFLGDPQRTGIGESRGIHVAGRRGRFG